MANLKLTSVKGQWTTDKYNKKQKVFFMNAYGEINMSFHVCWKYDKQGNKKLISVHGSFIKGNGDCDLINAAAEEMLKAQEAQRSVENA